MFKKLLFSVLLASSISISHADSCPNPQDLMGSQLLGWNFFTIDNGTQVLDQQTIKDYVKNISAFALAEWSAGDPAGEAHCYYYYQGTTNYGNLYVTHRHLVNKNTSVWKNSNSQICTAKDNYCQCKVGNEACEFVSH